MSRSSPGLAFVVVCLAIGCGGDAAPTSPAPDPRPATIALTAPSDTLTFLGNMQVSAVVYDEKGAPMSPVQLSWTTSNANVVTVDQQGVVVATGVGKTSIRAVAGSASRSMDVTVVPRVWAIDGAPSTARQFELIRVPLPSHFTMQGGMSVVGRFGSVPVTGALVDRDIAFTVPKVTPGGYAVQFELTSNEASSFSLEVTAAPTVANVGSVGGALIDSVAGALDGFETAEWAAHGFDGARLAQVRQVLGEARAQFVTLPAEDQERIVHFLRDLGVIQTADGYGPPLDKFNAFVGTVLAQQVALADTFAKCSLAMVAGSMVFGVGAGVVLAVCGGVILGEVILYWKSIEDYFNQNVFDPLALEFQPSGLQRGSNGLMLASSIEPLTFQPAGSTRPIPMRVQLQTLSRSKASGVGRGGELFAGLDKINAAFQALLSLLPESMRPSSMYTGAVVPRSEWHDAASTGTIQLLSTSRSDVSCLLPSGASITCRATSGQATHAIDFAATLQYDNGFGTVTAAMPGRIVPPDVSYSTPFTINYTTTSSPTQAGFEHVVCTHKHTVSGNLDLLFTSVGAMTHAQAAWTGTYTVEGSGVPVVPGTCGGGAWPFNHASSGVVGSNGSFGITLGSWNIAGTYNGGTQVSGTIAFDEGQSSYSAIRK